MAEKSSAQPNIENESSEPLGASSLVGEPIRGDMTSQTNTKVANDNSRLVLTQAQTQSSLGGEMAPSSSKKPRGRPPGSKNKPKNIPLIEKINSTMESIVLLIPTGNDIIESVISFAQSHNSSITVLSGSGLVTDVTLLNNTTRAPTFPNKGTFNIVSLKGTYINPNCEPVPPESIIDPPCSSFTIVLCGDKGHCLCGTIAGKVKVVGYVKVTATLLKGLSFKDETHQ